MPCLVFKLVESDLFSLSSSLVKFIKDFLGPGWEMAWIGTPDDLELHYSCLLSGIRDTAQKKSACVCLAYSSPSCWYPLENTVRNMLAGFSKAQYYYFCLKAFSSAHFEGEKVAWRESTNVTM